ncbi:MAG TPA: alpha-ketoglutarate-dependent dioxygenase AlkB [Methylomirabilota bacterium]|jgi:alkylated DNA repair dioxygenase AlkB|nr:alpha-ketoglutarate-dependent dioxygenase AlkB [Methylomirabilota bacterium]
MLHPGPQQRSFFDSGAPDFDARLGGVCRITLDKGAWLDHLPAWLKGHDSVLEALWSTTRWQAQRRRMYDRVVDVPRLFATLPEDGPGHPILDRLADTLSDRYGRPLHDISLAAYRDGRDSVAFHGDRLGLQRADAIVAIVSLGAPRRFLLRPAGGGSSRAFELGWGDLLVMGGTCQLTWEHAVPKVARAGLRISVQFRSATEEVSE